MRLPRFSLSVVTSKTVLFSIAAILLLGISVALGQVWAKKEYKEWSAGDCEKILTNSPWAKNQSYYGSGLGSAGEGGQAYTKFVVQLLSSSPIRQATIRQQQIASKYDKLPPEEKQKFDQQAASYLSTDYSQKVVVKVNYETNVSSAVIDMDRSWRTKTIAHFQNSAFLIGSKGVKVAADGYSPSAKESYFILTFPRLKDGKPILSAEDKSLILQFEYSPIQSMGDGKGQFEFKVKDMIFNGEIGY
jgi:hypothetical protein